MTLPAALTQSLSAAPAATTSDVLAVMRAIEAALAPSGAQPADGIAWFNRLYMTTTEAIVKGIEGGEFEDAVGVASLDVAFANLYFDALRRFAAVPSSTPRAWRPLFLARSQVNIAPIQFAVAGMNAHINRDLPVALCQVWKDPRAGRGRGRTDFDRVNRVLARVQDEGKERFLQGSWKLLDKAFGRVDDVVAIFSISEARNAAWTHGEVLTTLGGPDGLLGRAYIDSMDGIVGMAGRGLLVPTAL